MPDVDDGAELLRHCLVVRGIEIVIVGSGFSPRTDRFCPQSVQEKQRPNLWAVNECHSDLVRTRREVMEREETVNIL
jgi:hypothetical protein